MPFSCKFHSLLVVSVIVVGCPAQKFEISLFSSKSNSTFTFCLSVCLFSLNLRGLKSHGHETWHVGPLSDVDVQGLSGILIFDRVAPQAHAA